MAPQAGQEPSQGLGEIATVVRVPVSCGPPRPTWPQRDPTWSPQTPLATNGVDKLDALAGRRLTLTQTVRQGTSGSAHSWSIGTAYSRSASW